MKILEEITNKEKIEISNSTFWLIILGLVIVGIICYFLLGITRIKKNHAAIYEKLGRYIGTFKNGFIYLLPLVYKRAGYYKLKNNNKEIYVGRRKLITINYDIIDVKKYHYSGHNLEEIVKEFYQEKNIDDDKYLINKLQNVGIKLISIEEK